MFSVKKGPKVKIVSQIMMWQGAEVLDIRTYVIASKGDKKGEWIPTSKGVQIPISKSEQYGQELNRLTQRARKTSGRKKGYEDAEGPFLIATRDRKSFLQKGKTVDEMVFTKKAEKAKQFDTYEAAATRAAKTVFKCKGLHDIIPLSALDD